MTILQLWILLFLLLISGNLIRSVGAIDGVDCSEVSQADNGNTIKARIILIEFVGRPSTIKPQDIQSLQSIIPAAYQTSCSSTIDTPTPPDLPYFKIDNTTILVDEVQPQPQLRPQLSSDLFNMALNTGSSSSSTTSFLWPVSLDFVTNLDLTLDGSILFSQNSPERHLKLQEPTVSFASTSTFKPNTSLRKPKDQQQHLQLLSRRPTVECGCGERPSQDTFIASLNNLITTSPGLNRSIDGVVSVKEMKDYQCSADFLDPTSTSVNNGDDDNTAFTISFGIEMVGHATLANNDNLSILAELIRTTYHRWNRLDGCDPQVRTITNIQAVVDPQSIVVDGVLDRRRKMEESSSGGSDETVDGERSLFRGIFNKRVIGMVSGTPAPTTHSSTHSSTHPSTQPSAMSSSTPSMVPTELGPGTDTFTVLIQLEMACPDCDPGDLIFDTDQRDRKRNLAGNIVDVSNQQVSRNLVSSSFLWKSTMDACVCAVDAKEERTIPQDAFLASIMEWISSSSELGTDLNFAEEFLSMEEVQLFDCVKEKDDFVSFALTEFTGDITALSLEDIAIVKETFLSSFNALAEETCDPEY